MFHLAYREEKENTQCWVRLFKSLNTRKFHFLLKIQNQRTCWFWFLRKKSESDSPHKTAENFPQNKKNPPFSKKFCCEGK
jgi:hypothetical protein